MDIRPLTKKHQQFAEENHDLVYAFLNKKKLPDFQKAVADTVNRYFDELSGDVSHFCKKFDYRYENEPWGNSKDSIERAIKFISGDRRLKYEKPKKKSVIKAHPEE